MFRQPGDASQWETEPASRCSKTAGLDGGVLQLAKGVVFNFLAKYEGMLHVNGWHEPNG
jgi:hypothetical protein